MLVAEGVAGEVAAGKADKAYFFGFMKHRGGEASTTYSFGIDEPKFFYNLAFAHQLGN